MQVGYVIYCKVHDFILGIYCPAYIVLPLVRNKYFPTIRSEAIFSIAITAVVPSSLKLT